MRVLKKGALDNMGVSPVPCTTDLFKRLKAYQYTNSAAEAQEIDECRSLFRMYLGIMGHWAQTSMPQLKTTVRIASKFMSRPTKLHFKLVIMVLRYCKYCVVNGIKLAPRRPKGFDGVLKLLLFADSDHSGNDDASSNSGMASFLNGNYFHGFSSGQTCQTLNTAESEYIAMVKALQFGIWAVLFLRELHFRLMYPIPLLGDNQAAILIAKSPTHTKFVRHINIKYHYIRTILPFKDFILAYVKSKWNIADLNTNSLPQGEYFLDAVSISPCSRPVGPIAPRLTTQTYHKIIPSLGHTFGSTLRPILTAIWSHRGQLMGSERPLWAHPEAQGPCCRPPAPPAVPTYQRRG
jgi:hypothetical protein